MALFLKDCSPEKIMILGRWRSTTYLDYIRPQVAELTDLLSSDMISFENFFELCSNNNSNEKKASKSIEPHFDIPNLLNETYEE